MKNILLAGIAVIIIIVALLVTIPFIPDDWEDPVDPDNPTLDASFKQEIVLRYDDWTFETVSSSTKTLEAYYNDKEISMIFHKLYAKLDDGANSITFNSDVLSSIVNLYQGNTHIRGPAVNENGLINNVVVTNGDGWVLLAEVGVAPDTLIWGVSSGSGYTGKLKLTIPGFEYEYNGVWKSINPPPEISFNLDII